MAGSSRRAPSAASRSSGDVLRARPDRPALLLGLSGVERQISGWNGHQCTHATEMLDLIVVDGKARGSSPRDLQTGAIDSHAGDVWCWQPAATATSSTCPQRQGVECTAIWRHIAGCVLRQPVLHADPSDVHPTIGRAPVEATLMSESLRNDGRVWVPKKKGTRGARTTSESERDYLPRTPLPDASATSCRATSPHGPPKEVCDEGRGAGPRPRRVSRLGRRQSRGSALDDVKGEVGNLFEKKDLRAITATTPIACPCASIRRRTTRWAALGRLSSDVHLSPALRRREANCFPYQGANRLGASALMQGLSTATSSFRHRAGLCGPAAKPEKSIPRTPHSAEAGEDARRRTHMLLKVDGPADRGLLHRELGDSCGYNCGMARPTRSGGRSEDPGADARSSTVNVRRARDR